MTRTPERCQKDALSALTLALERSPNARKLDKSRPEFRDEKAANIVQVACRDPNAVFAPEEYTVMVVYLRDLGIHVEPRGSDMQMSDRERRDINLSCFKVRKVRGRA